MVSIVMPTWNCGRFIAESIKSVQGQSLKDWELIIVDDCSTDNTRKIVEYFHSEDTRIKYHSLSKNSGAAVARNIAIKLAKGKYIAFLDSDDLWDKHKLERQIKFMEENDYAFSYHGYHEINEDGVDLHRYVGGKGCVGKYDMFACCWPGCLTVMYDREKIGLIQVTNIKKNNDTAMWLKAIKESPCYFLSEDLAAYRRRKGSITPPTIFQKIWAHYPLFRDGEKMSPLRATFWTLMNVLGNGYKKIFYVMKY